jgi:hypothetical protein
VSCMIDDGLDDPAATAEPECAGKEYDPDEGRLLENGKGSPALLDSWCHCAVSKLSSPGCPRLALRQSRLHGRRTNLPVRPVVQSREGADRVDDHVPELNGFQHLHVGAEPQQLLRGVLDPLEGDRH